MGTETAAPSSVTWGAMRALSSRKAYCRISGDTLARPPAPVVPGANEVPDGAIVHCQIGLRGYFAARLLEGYGKHVRNLDGGYRTWARV